MNTKIFCDIADLKTIRTFNKKSVVDGFTTNPSLMRKAGAKNYKDYSLNILKSCKIKPISFEVFADNPKEILKQAYKINGWGKNVYVKIPVINSKGVKPDPDKVKAIRTLPTPISVKNVRSMMGMCGYYRPFIPNFSEIAEPLIALTKKYAKFRWTPECQRAFDFLKDSLTVVPLLAYPDTNKPYVLYTDASNSCIGSCLTQEVDGEEKPINYLSHKLSPSQKKYSTIEKECFAIFYSLQKLDHYLHNAQFVIKSDHKPLKYILDAPMQNKRIQLWALSIAAYNCKVEYIKGTANTCADLLSRIPDNAQEGTEESDKGPSLDDVDVDDRHFEINTLNSNRFNPRKFASCQIDDLDDLKKPEIDLPDFDLVQEQEKDDTILSLKKRL